MPVKIEGKSFYSVLEAATALDVVPETVRNYIKSGKLMPAYTGKPTLIAEDKILAIHPNSNKTAPIAIKKQLQK